MQAIAPKTRNRFLKRTLIIAGIFLVILLALRIWFAQNARSVLKNYITEQSRGKIKLELSDLDINFFAKRLQVHEVDLLSTDSTHEPITYHVTFSKLSLRVGSVWSLLFKKKLLLDSIKLYNPVIQVMQWRKDTAQVVVKDELSLPQEMGKLYNSLIQALDEFGVRRIVIDNAKISLINKMKPNSEAVVVSNIFFDLVRAPVVISKKTSYNRNAQTIQLSTSEQNIVLPGGRHHLSFKSFKLQLFRERIELDSCTLTAIATDSLKSNYKIFFKKLLLTGVDFAALSTKNVIKADTVFCDKPFFSFNLYRSDAIKKKTETPDPSKLIRELTGNLNLAYVGVKNAGIYFNINGKKKQSFFNSNKDNFEMEGFRIKPDSSVPVTLSRFNMTLRDYHLYNEDSSSTYSFDSLHFLNSKIELSNFAMTSNPGGAKAGNHVNIRVPYFQLTQLDWYQLIFEQKMVAKEAILNNPVINLTRKSAKANGRKVNLFAALQNLDTLVGLEKVSVLRGQVNMQLGASTYFNVNDVDFTIYSNTLLGSTTKEGLRSAVDHLRFSYGVLRLKDFTAQLRNAEFTANNLVYADKVTLSATNNDLHAEVNKVYIDKVESDDNADNIEVDGVRWESATIALNTSSAEKKEKKGNGSNVYLRNIDGNNTRFNFSDKSAVVSTFIETLNVASLSKQKNEQLKTEGFFISGNNLFVKSNEVKVMADSYKITGTESSSLSGVRVEQVHGHDSLNISSPLINFSADINDIFANNLHLKKVNALAPVIKISKWDTSVAAQDSQRQQSPIRIDQLTATEPDIHISTHRHDSVAALNIPRVEKSLVKASGIDIAGGTVAIESLIFNTTTATYVKPTGEILGVEKGKIDMDFSNIQIGKKDGKMNWSGLINNLYVLNASGLQMGKTKNNVRFQQASLGNLSLSSEFLPDFSQLMKANLSAWLRIPQGQFVDSNITLKWYNANYDNTSRTLNLDSFIYHPTQPLDSVLAYAPYQLDYVTLKTGSIAITGLDVARYKKDSSLFADTIKINSPVLTVFRDKKPPSSPDSKDKPLPVNMIKNLSIPVLVQSLLLDNGTITYSEKNGDSRKQGDLLLTNISGGLENIKNSTFTPDDSLLLTFNATLMNAGRIRLRLKESYTDSLSGFLMNTTMSYTDPSVLNPFLVPIANAKITSGIVDSVSYRVVARQDLALGEMHLRYRNLRVKLVDDGDPVQSTFVQDILSFLANTFVIKKNNTNRTGVIYYKHIPSQSFVNYVVQATLSGLISSVGVKKNRKYMKQYKQALKESKLPEVHVEKL